VSAGAVTKLTVLEDVVGFDVVVVEAGEVVVEAKNK
jgi:hypothetical protein